MTKKTKVLATSIASIAMCASIAVGGTFALFTSESEVNIAVTSGKVKMNALVDTESVVMTSLGETMTGDTWANGGFASVSGGEVTLTNLTPGDKVSFDIKITNESTVNVQYRTVVSCVEGLDLFNGLVVTLDYANDEVEAQQFDGETAYGYWTLLAPQTVEEDKEDVDTVTVTIELPDRSNGELTYGDENQNNQYQGLSCKLNYRVEAIQGNAWTADIWDGTVDSTWYNASKTSYTLETSAQLAGLAELINNGTTTFAGKTIKLARNMDLNNINWTPIGSSSSRCFSGTFDGNGYAVANLSVSYNNYGAGFFSNTVGATIKNFKIIDAHVVGANIAGVVAAYSYGDGIFENVHVQNSIIEGYGKVGVVLGMSADPGRTTTFINCSVSDSQLKATYNAAGLAGLAQGPVILENCSVDVDVELGAPEEDYVTYTNATATKRTYEGVKDELYEWEWPTQEEYDAMASTITINGTYWKYAGTYLFAGYAEYYCDYTLGYYYEIDELILDSICN